MIVPVGGGGLISAVATALKSVRPDVRVIGVEPDTAAVIHHSIKAGGEAMSIPWPKSLADGLNSPSSNELNLAHIDAYVDEMVLIPEASIGPAWRELLTVGKFAGEPAAAVGIAAIQCGAVTVSPDEKVCLILSGGNADLDQLAG